MINVCNCPRCTGKEEETHPIDYSDDDNMKDEAYEYYLGLNVEGLI